MINKYCIKNYCKEYTKIENYDKAMADTTQTWHCHHRLEEFVSKKWLIEHNDYYNVSPNELIFLTKSEHHRLHGKTKKGKNNPMYGKSAWVGRKHSEETKQKMSKSLKGKPSPRKGKHWKVENGKRIWY